MFVNGWIREENTFSIAVEFEKNIFQDILFQLSRISLFTGRALLVNLMLKLSELKQKH